MSLKKKIILGFVLSASIIALLVLFLFMNFVEIRNETVFLELTDTIRSKSLQLRRHEKNYFLYAPVEAGGETKAIHAYLDELDGILADAQLKTADRTGPLKDLVRDYRRQFSSIESLVNAVSKESDRLKRSSPAYAGISPLIVANFLDKPLTDVRYLQRHFSLASNHPFIARLKELELDINGLRKTGENILVASKELDRSAREKVDSFNHRSRNAVLVFFPLFLIVGFGTFLFIIGNVARRLQRLTDVVEKAGEGLFSQLPVSSGTWTGLDEVETLTRKFNIMEEHLVLREKELLQSKKLAAIGTLAAGVAHELNNPLNNIYTTAQRLMKKTGDDCPDHMRKGLDAIFGESMRVKRIVGELLTFARGRDLHIRPVELRGAVEGVFRHLGDSIDTGGIRFHEDFRPKEIVVYADQEQLEQVFINLFSNASDAMAGSGDLSITAVEDAAQVIITITDTGVGMSKESLEKLFEPFYTTKDKGTGLGLAIVFNIIQKHHGRIEVESREGQGTTFTIKLPKSEESAKAG